MFQIRKQADGVWKHIDTVNGLDYILSKFYAKSNNNEFLIVEYGGSQRIAYGLSDITVYDDTGAGTPETFATFTELFQRLFDLRYPAFDYSGEFPDTYWVVNGDGNLIPIITTGRVLTKRALYVGEVDGNDEATGFAYALHWNIRRDQGSFRDSSGTITLRALTDVPGGGERWAVTRMIVEATDQSANYTTLSHVSKAYVDALAAAYANLQAAIDGGATYSGSADIDIQANSFKISSAGENHFKAIGGTRFEGDPGASSVLVQTDNLDAPRTRQWANVDGNEVQSVNGKVANTSGAITLVASDITGAVKTVIKDLTTSSAVTGTTAETLVSTHTIAANTFASSDVMRIPEVGFIKTGTAGNMTVRLYIGSTNVFGSATLVATYTATTTYLKMARMFSVKGGNLVGTPPASSVSSDVGVSTGVAGLSTAFNPAATAYLFVSVQLGSAADSAVQSELLMTN